MGDPVSRIITLKDGRVHCLPNAYAVDGRVSWHGSQARGWAPFNCFLFTGRDGAVLVDTGLTVHRDAVIAQLNALIDRDTPLRIMHLRQGEFDSVCNTLPIVERFNVVGIHGLVHGGWLWTDLLPVRDDDSVLRSKLDKVAYEKFKANPVVAVDSSWELKIVDPVMRLLNTFWLYDAASRTMLTSDVFTYLVAGSPAGPWQVGVDDPLPRPEVVREHLIDTRFWWLPGADTDTLRRGLDEHFETNEVETIAPSFGSIIRGAAAVEAHRALLDEVLSELGQARATADVGR